MDFEDEEEHPENMLQEELGEVSHQTNLGPAFVFAQRWPSWSFAVEALGFKDISTCVDWSGAVAREEFRSTSLGPTLVTLSAIKRRLENYKASKLMPPLVFIQGNLIYLESCLKLFTNAGIDCACICASIRNLDGSYLPPKDVHRIKSLHWREVSHKGMAGVTTGNWHFGSSVNLTSFGGLKLSPIRRTMTHVLKTTERGTYCTSKAKSFRGLTVHERNTRAPFGIKRFGVITPSVFIPASEASNLVLREITIRELMDVYDMELSVQRELHEFWSTSQSHPSREFVLQTPVKALFGPASQVLGALTLSQLSSPLDATCDPLGIESDKAPVPVPDILLQSEMAVDSGSAPLPSQHTNFGMEPDVTPTADPSSSGPDVKAAKHDDAEVNVAEWDLWTVNNYLPPTPADAPKICIPGSYNDATKHCFQMIRRFMLRAYKRRLLRGFLKFLNLEHDHGKRVPYSVTYDILLDGGGRSSISANVEVSPWSLSKLKKKVPTRSKGPIPANDDLIRDLTRGIDCLERAGRCTFWEWKDGSSIFFWRWPSRYKRALRDGTKLFVIPKHLPHFNEQQVLPKDPSVREKLLSKIQVPRNKRYIVPGFVLSKTGYFDVPKGESDIRIVYDATKCGLNRALWSPNFYLPTIDALLRNADSDTYYGDIDLGEMFLNYALDEALRPYAGVDVTALEPDRVRKGVKAVIERWERTLMGLRPSPYVCTQTFSWSEEIIRGRRMEKGNPLRWDKVILNLPGDPSYDPAKPRVYKWNSETNSIAGSFGTYVDDIRTQHQSEKLCRDVTRRVASGVGYLGQQDAPRKRRWASQRPGAWSGAICFSVKGEGLYVSCSQEKWDKGKRLIEELYQSVVVRKEKWLDRKTLEKHVGFLVHLSRTFPALFPYLKGIYLTMESWRVGRDDEGWKFSRKAWWNLMAGALDEADDDTELTFEEKKRKYISHHEKNTPPKVKAVRRLGRDLSSLRRLFDHDAPPKRLVRGQKVQEALYSFGDASGGGFGASWMKNGKTWYRAGTWGSDMDNESSNHRELRNLVDSLEVMEKDGRLSGTEAFIFTDNSTAESAFYKGSSSSLHLFELIVRLRELEMRAGCKVTLVHVSGTRMIEQGSDGLSRGNFTEGTMKGKSIFDFIPIARSAMDRSPGLKDWLRNWTGEKDLEFLDPEGWFERGHDLVEEGDTNAEGHWIPRTKPGKFVWCPPPAAADVAVEELRKARHKRQESTHIFIVPRLMKPQWHKQLCKVSDIVLTLPSGHPMWDSTMHEPLTIGLCFPYLKYRPWELRRSRKLLDLGRYLHELWKEDCSTEGHLLRELWLLPSKLGRLSPFLARKVLQGIPESELSHCSPRKRSRGKVEEEEGRGAFSSRKKR